MLSRIAAGVDGVVIVAMTLIESEYVEITAGDKKEHTDFVCSQTEEKLLSGKSGIEVFYI